MHDAIRTILQPPRKSYSYSTSRFSVLKRIIIIIQLFFTPLPKSIGWLSYLLNCKENRIRPDCSVLEFRLAMRFQTIQCTSIPVVRLISWLLVVFSEFPGSIQLPSETKNTFWRKTNKWNGPNIEQNSALRLSIIQCYRSLKSNFIEY